MVSWWPGDGDATDIAGTNDGTISGATYTGGGADAAPISGNVDALRFDGLNDEVNVPHAANLDFGAADLLLDSLASRTLDAVLEARAPSSDPAPR